MTDMTNLIPSGSEDPGSIWAAGDNNATLFSLSDCLNIPDDLDINMWGFNPWTNVTVAKKDCIQELSVDGINSERYNYREHRTLIHNPEPAISFHSVPAITNLCHVPIHGPVHASTFDVQTSVINTLPFTDHGQRGATIDVRRPGNFTASVLATIGADMANATSAPISGLLCRVAQAILCADTGATAALAPNVPGWDIRVVNWTDLVTYRDIYPSHLPVFIPCDIGKPAAEALVSLLLPGGAAAYGWRFRVAPPDPRAAYMPSYARILYPGGNAQILMVGAELGNDWSFGGAALSIDRLAQLERWLRNKFGNDMMDSAFKTMAACGHIYCAPVADGTNLGEKFEVYVATTNDGANDLRGSAFMWNAGPAPTGIVAARHAEVNVDRHVAGFDAAVRDSARAMYPGMAFVLGAHPWGANNLPIDSMATPKYHPNLDTISISWSVRAQHCSLKIPLKLMLRHIMAPNNGHPDYIARFAAVWLQKLAGNLADFYGAADFDDSTLPPPAGFRNCFGYDDSCVFVLPKFSVRDITPVLAGVHRVNVQFGHQSSLNAQNRRERLRHYIAKMHVAHILTVVGENVWPDILDIGLVEHWQLVVKMPKGLQPMTYLEDASRYKLDAPNWQILESVSRLKGTNPTTAYHGYNSSGTWDLSQEGHVHINNMATSCAALDSCLRVTWMWGDKVDAGSLMPVRDTSGLIAPLGFAPIVKSSDGPMVDGVSLIWDDINDLGRGRTCTDVTVISR
ncbi:unnamed protein product [Penicillium bialowiezense]